jgi:hypothetical protein
VIIHAENGNSECEHKPRKKSQSTLFAWKVAPNSNPAIHRSSLKSAKRELKAASAPEGAPVQASQTVWKFTRKGRKSSKADVLQVKVLS